MDGSISPIEMRIPWVDRSSSSFRDTKQWICSLSVSMNNISLVLRMRHVPLIRLKITEVSFFAV